MAWRAWTAMLLLAAALGGLAVSVWHVGDAIAARGTAPPPSIGDPPAVAVLEPSGPVVVMPGDGLPEPFPDGAEAPVTVGDEKEAGAKPGDSVADVDIPGNLPPDALPGPESIVPISLKGFPDDPPPHEGAYIDVPHIVEPPDIIRVEILEALPGRQITGERLVRPDGTISLDFYGDLHVRGLTTDQIRVKVVLFMREFLNDSTLGLVMEDEEGKVVTVLPDEADRVFVDVLSYNTKYYYVSGDVNAPSKLPITGQETVLDAINAVGGLAPTAEPRDIRLYRPARGDKPAKDYAIDWEAIQRGEKSANLQILPGDRLVIGRNAVVQASVKTQRLSEPIQNLISQIQFFASMRKNLKESGLDESQIRAVIDAAIRLHRDNAHQPDGPTLDEETLRKALMPLDAKPDPR